jgi:uncharacterized membrane protein YfcA
MDLQLVLLIAALMGLAAMLYTSVGHAGASAYLAIMALFSLPAATMKPTALVLNIIVASYASFRYVRAGQFNLRLWLPFVIGAVPVAFLGGWLHLPGQYYRPLVGVCLLAAAIRLLWPKVLKSLDDPHPPAPWIGVLVGAAVGLISGLTGTGGGIFLSPIILFLGWEGARKTSGVAVAFILCVSIAGLAGALSGVGRLPPELPIYAGAVVLGALVGTQLGIVRLPQGRILQALGVVLTIAAGKLILT